MKFGLFYLPTTLPGVRDVGTRSVVAIGPTRPPHPATYVRLEGGRRKRLNVSFEQQMATCRTLIDRWHGTHRRPRPHRRHHRGAHRLQHRGEERSSQHHHHRLRRYTTMQGQ